MATVGDGRPFFANGFFAPAFFAPEVFGEQDAGGGDPLEPELAAIVLRRRLTIRTVLSFLRGR